MLRLLVCGGRKFGKLPMKPNGLGPDRDHPDWDARYAELMFIKKTLDQFCIEHNLVTPLKSRDQYGNYLPERLDIIHGGATGADTGADEWAVTNWVPVTEYKADWERYDYKAGHIRNQQMLVEGKPDIVMAFPGGNGTADMVSRARMAGVKVIKVTYDEKQPTFL